MDPAQERLHDVMYDTARRLLIAAGDTARAERVDALLASGGDRLARVEFSDDLFDQAQSHGGLGDERYAYAARCLDIAHSARYDVRRVCHDLVELIPVPLLVTLLAEGFGLVEACDAEQLLGVNHL